MLDDSLRLGAQLRDALRSIIVNGRLKSGFRLPASRELARQLGVSRNTVLYAYEELAADGLLDGRVGSGTRVRQEIHVVQFVDPDGLMLECIGR